MNIIFASDLIGLVFSAYAIIIIFLSCAKKGCSESFRILLGLISLIFFNAMSNMLEWSGITSQFDQFEDFITVVQPVLWIFFLQAFLDTKTAEDLKKALQEKEVLLGEVHHRVKNNLLTLYSLVNLQQKSVEDKIGVSGALQDTKQRIQAIGNVHQMLYTSKSFSEIDFSIYIENMIEEMKTAHYADDKKIDIVMELEPIVLHMDTAIPCALILNEILVNAFKHAFPGRSEGHIGVCLKRMGRGFELIVRDNGIGMPEDLLPGTGKTLGLRLIDMLSKQLKGNVLYKRDQGSVFTIIFKDAVG